MDLKILAENSEKLLRMKFGSVKQGLTACGLSTNVVDNIKNGSVPSVEKVVAISQTLNVSVDYLLGIEKPPTMQGLSEKEENLIKYFRAVDDAGRDVIFRVAENEFLIHAQNEPRSQILEIALRHTPDFGKDTGDSTADVPQGR